MTIRTKIWLIAVSVAVTVGVASWGRMFVTRDRSSRTRRQSAEEIAHDIAEDLKSVQPDADDRDLEEKLLGYLNRHSRIVRLDLYVYREAYTPSSRIAAPRGDRPEITRFAPFARQPIGFARRQVGGIGAGPADRAARRPARALEGDAGDEVDAGPGRIVPEDGGEDLDHLRRSCSSSC